ncbi:MAG: flagellar biosynthesis anti-sigma factor FlgM [Deltaproteobacteria bacterium]|nr:flagellar biosynthesis anti-sigma factor FlgM [Deltaproteobacteria bacterium]
MKVNDSNVVRLLDAILRTPDSKREKGEPGNKTVDVSDIIELSRKKTFEEIKKEALRQPEVRSEEIDEVKQLVETKTYNMRGQIVAKAIIKSHLLDAIL